MPILKSHYNPPLIFKSGHFSTIHSGLYRSVTGVYQKRKRITLNDQDFIDLDWSYAAYQKNVSKLIVILHGLEGNAQRSYIKGTAKIFNRNGYDAVAMNLRSCSGEPNKLFRSYNAGASEDLREVMEYIVTNYPQYNHIVLKGFSLGGNMLLKYLGGLNFFITLRGSIPVTKTSSLNKAASSIECVTIKTVREFFFIQIFFSN